MPDRCPVSGRTGRDDLRTAGVILHLRHLRQGDVGVVEHAAVGADDRDPDAKEPGSAPYEIHQAGRVAEARPDLFGEEVDLASEPVTRAVLDGAVRDADGDPGQRESERERQKREQEVQTGGETHGS